MGFLRAVALDEEFVLNQHLRNVFGCLARNLDPSLGEESAGGKDEAEVEDGVERVAGDVSEVGGWRHVVGKTGDWLGGALATASVLPDAKKADHEVSAVAVVEQLREEVQVGHQGRLQDDGDVGGVEQLDGVRANAAAVAVGHELKLDLETLEVNDHNENEHGGQKVGEVRQVGAAPGLEEGAGLVRVVDEEVEERDDGALEFGALAGVDRGGAEGLPHDVLANVRGDEERDAVVDTIALLQEFVEDDDDDTGEEKLQDDEESVAHAELVDRAVHARDDVSDGLTDGDEDTEQLLGAVEQGLVVLCAQVDFNDLGSSKELHHQAGRDDGADTELHEGAAVGGKDDAHPVEGVGVLGVLDAVQRDLAADQEDEEGDHSPQHFVAERDRLLWWCHFGHDHQERLDELKETERHGCSCSTQYMRPPERRTTRA